MSSVAQVGPVLQPLPRRVNLSAMAKAKAAAADKPDPIVKGKGVMIATQPLQPSEIMPGMGSGPGRILVSRV